MLFLRILFIAVVVWVSIFITNTIYLLVKKYLFKVKSRSDQPSIDNKSDEVHNDD